MSRNISLDVLLLKLRQNKEKKELINLTINPKLRAVVDQVAKNTGLTRGTMIELALMNILAESGIDLDAIQVTESYSEIAARNLKGRGLPGGGY
jgi:antitoxin component of RelBE/YafQ-DinJ toxin-antitoxin module